MPDLSGAIVVEQVNVDPLPDWRAESPVVDLECAEPPCARVGCTLRNLGRDPGEAEIRFVLDTRPEPLEAFATVPLGAGEKKAVFAEFADVALDPGQTFGRCEIGVVGSRVTCWVKNPASVVVQLELVARLLDVDPVLERSGRFSLQPSESRPIPFPFDRRGRRGSCQVR